LLNLHTMKPRLRNKTMEVLLLANNYHSVTGSDIEEYNASYLIDAIQKQWAKINQKLKENGWEEIHLGAVGFDNAEIIAYRLLNRYDPRRYR